jgi:hypothetical protein
MTGALANGDTLHPFFTPIKLAEFEVSCVAPNPFRNGFSFGSDDGKVMFTDDVGTPSATIIGSPSGEAINGIASFGKSFAVSSRHEVTLRSRSEEHFRSYDVLQISLGAHGICATPGGHYIAPLGGSGIMVLRVDSAPGDPAWVMTTEKESMNFYRIVARRTRDGEDLLICAARQGGIGVVQANWGENTYTMRTATFPELDAVDICHVGGNPLSPALAAVGRDGTLVLARGLLHDENPLTMKFDAVKGRAYRLLSARGHLFLLTSSGLYGLMNLGARLLEGFPTGKFTTPIFVMPMEAVDASLIGDRWLMAVLPDEVYRLDLEFIHNNTPRNIGAGEIRAMTSETVEATTETVEMPWEF